MPSVQELLAALDAQKSPFISLLEGVAGGYANAQQNRLENAKRLMELDQMRQQQAQQQQMRDDIARQIESQTQSSLRGTGGVPAVQPTQKLKRTITQDAKGQYSQSFETVDTAPKDVSYEPRDYQDAQGINRTGKVNKSTGEFITSPNDPLAPKQPTSPEDAQAAKDAAKLKREMPKAQGALDATLHEYDNMINEAQAIKVNPDLGEATGLLQPLTHVPGTAAKAVSARINTLKAKTLLNVLSSLKQLSANGSSGFGQLSGSEGDAIKNSISSLDPMQSKKDFQDSLDRFINEMKFRKQNLMSTFESTYGSAPTQSSPNDSSDSPPEISSQAQYDALPSGATYMANGVLHRKK